MKCDGVRMSYNGYETVSVYEMWWQDELHWHIWYCECIWNVIVGWVTVAYMRRKCIWNVIVGWVTVACMRRECIWNVIVEWVTVAYMRCECIWDVIVEWNTVAYMRLWMYIKRDGRMNYTGMYCLVNIAKM